MARKKDSPQKAALREMMGGVVNICAVFKPTKLSSFC